MRLEGACALVTGGSKRVGRAIVLALARRGVNVAIHYNRSGAEARALAKELAASFGIRTAAVKAELGDARQAAAAATEAVRKLGALDILVNNASVYDAHEFGKTTPADWNRQMDVNARAPFFLAQAAAPHLAKSGTGKIVNIADWSAHRPYARYIAYCASKAALLCVNAALAKQLGPRVQVNAVMPGPVALPPGTTPVQAEKVRQATLVKRLGSPEDVARAVLFLIENDFITGAQLAVDGGRLAN